MRPIVALVRAMFLISLLFLCVYPAAGQSRQAAEVRGTVTDQSGAVVPGATVTLTNKDTGVRQKATTGTAGVYEVPFVPPGEYTISFEKAGFTRLIRQGVTLHIETVTLDARLEVGSSEQRIEVVAAAPLLQTESPESRTILAEQTVDTTPNVGRSWYNLLGLLPGVSGGGGQNANGEGASVNGQGSEQSSWQIDGGHAMFTDNQNPDLLTPPLDAIAEVNLVTANFGAEYGNGLSVFNVITKSGTNQWHGTAFEYVQNDKLEARNYFAQGNLPLRWNEFGGTLGGPIRRDKAFFFFSYQGNPTSTSSPGLATMPTDAMRHGDFSDPQFQTIYDPASLTQVNGNWVRSPLPGNIVPTSDSDKVAAAIQQYFPEPNQPGIANNYYYVQHNPMPTHWFSGKVDYNLTSNNRLSGSLMIVPQSFDNPAPVCAIDCTSWKNRENQGQVTDVWTISPNVVNEFRFSMVHMHGQVTNPTVDKGYPEKLGLANPASDTFPTVTIEGTSGASIGTGWPLAIDAESAFVPADTLTWIKGKHVMKFGGQFDRWWYNGGWPMANEGNFDFSGIFTRNPSDPTSSGEGYADFLFGLPDSWSVNYVPDIGGRMWSAQSFAQDEYKIRSNLTLTLGLRWVIQSGWSEAHNRLLDFDPTLVNPATGTLGALWFAGQDGRTALQNTDWHFLAPRAGFAWSPLPKWSIRGGYGIYNMTWGAYAYGANTLGVGWATEGSLTSTDMIHPIFSLSAGPPAPIYPTANLRTASLLNGQYVNYYPSNTPMAYAEEYRLDVQHEFKGRILMDAAYVGNRGLHLPFPRDINQVPAQLLGPGDAQARRPYPQYGGINAYLNGDISNYNALQLTAKKDFANGLLFSVNYTFAKALDTMTVNGWYNAPDTWQNAYDRQADYGASSTDIRHMLNGNFLYAMPFGRGKRLLNRGGLLNGIFGGWQVSGMFQVHSGVPFTPGMGTADLSGALAGVWLPNRVASGTVSNPSISQWFDPSAFVQPAPYTFGNSGRNILYGPMWKDLDAMLTKNFALTERAKLQVKVEVFDIFNIPNFGQPDALIGTAGVGTITSANTSRMVQLGAKIRF